MVSFVLDSSTPRHLKSLKSLIESNVTVIQPKFTLRAPGGAEVRLMQSPSAEDDAEGEDILLIM